MAISYVGGASVLATNDNGSSFSSSSSFNVTGGADHALIVIVNWMTNGTSDPSGTTANAIGPSGAQPLVRVGNGTVLATGTPNPACNVLYLLDPEPGATSIDVAFNAFARACHITVMEIAGIDASSPTGAAVSDTTADGIYTTSVTTTGDGSFIALGVTYPGGPSGGYTPDPNTVEVSDTGPNSTNSTQDVCAFGGYRIAGPAGSYAVGATPTNVSLSSVVYAVEFNADTGGAITVVLEPDDATHGHEADQTSVQAYSVVAPNDATHGHTADAASLVVGGTIAPDSATHAHTVDSPAIAVAGTLSPDSAAHAHAVDSVAIAAVSSISPDDTIHAHTADATDIAVGGAIRPASALHGHTAQSPAITGSTTVAPDDAAHGHTATTSFLTIVVRLSPADIVHGHSATASSLVFTPNDNVFVPSEARTRASSRTARTGSRIRPLRTASSAR